MYSLPHQKTNFSSLPAELQLQIYHHAIENEALTKRVHSIYAHPRNPDIYISNQPVPSLLHLTSTSRSLYLTSIKPTYVYGTYINFNTDTLYLATCPDLPDESENEKKPLAATGRTGEDMNENDETRDGFEICKDLGKTKVLQGRIKRVAVRDGFWLRPRTVTRSIVVEAWNVLVKDGLGGGLEELLIVFDAPSPSSVSEQDECDGKELVEKTKRFVEFETIGWYQKFRDDFGEMMAVDERAKRCDAFLRAYLGVSTGESGWMRPVIKYVVCKKD